MNNYLFDGKIIINLTYLYEIFAFARLVHCTTCLNFPLGLIHSLSKTTLSILDKTITFIKASATLKP